MGRILSIILILVCTGNITVVNATTVKQDTMYAEGRYIMGDRDSKTDAQQYAILEAKRKIVEAAGTVIKSHSKTENYVLTEDEIESFSVGLIRTEVLEEKMEPAGETMAMIVKIQGIINPDEVQEMAKNAAEESTSKEELEALYEEYNELKAELETMKNEPAGQKQSEVKRPLKQAIATRRSQRIADRNEGWQELERLELLMSIVSESNKNSPNLIKMQNQIKILLKKYPTATFASGYMGIALYKHNRIKLAIENLRQGIAHKPATQNRREAPAVVKQKYRKQEALFHFYLGKCYQENGNVRLTRKHLLEARRLNPENSSFK